MDTDSNFIPEVTEDHEVIGSGARDTENNQNNSNYDTTMDLHVVCCQY